MLFLQYFGGRKLVREAYGEEIDKDGLPRWANNDISRLQSPIVR
jgi:hypothetical protein